MDECAFQPFGAGRETLLEENFFVTQCEEKNNHRGGNHQSYFTHYALASGAALSHQRYLQIHHIGQCRAGK